MTVIRPNSISGITSITAHSQSIEFYKSDGNLSGANLDGVNINTAGILTAANFKNASTNVHSIGIDVGSNIKLGSGGIITATSYRGDGSALTGITQTTINNNADNRVITGSGTANTLNGESGLVYNGYNLAISGTGQQQLNLGSTNAGGVAIILDGDSNGDAAGGDYSIIRHNTDGDLEFFARGPVGATNTIFRQGTSEKVRIDAGGNMNVTGVVTATAFHGDGSSLTGTGVGGNTSVNTTGIITATALVGDFQPRNMIINGAMQINQRESGTLTVNSSSSQYPCDRWVSRGEGGSKAFTIQKTSIASSGRGVRNSLKVTSSQAASVGNYDIFNVRQKIEGFNIQRLNLGEAGCASMALSFTVRSSVAGTHSGAIQNESQNRSYPFTYTLAENTWKDVKITIPPITSGSFNEGTGTGLILVFDLGCGNNFRGTAGQWNSAQNEGATGAVRILETNGATWEISKVQLEEGTVCTPFEKKLVGEELRNCKRYYQKDLNRRAYWGSGNVSDRQFPVRFGVEMRDTPTISFYSTSLDGGSAAAYNKTRQGYNFAMTGNGRFYEWAHTASAEL